MKKVQFFPLSKNVFEMPILTEMVFLSCLLWLNSLGRNVEATRIIVHNVRKYTYFNNFYQNTQLGASV